MRSAVSALELKVPPPAMALLTGGLMWFASSPAASSEFSLPGRTYLASAIALTGFALASLALFSFRRAATTVNPTRPGATSALVVSGVYRFTRNPMYLALLLVLLGWGVFLSNALAFVFLPAFVLYINRFQIAPEELALAQRFGPDFATYKASVRRWI